MSYRWTHSIGARILVDPLLAVSNVRSGIYKFILSMLRALAALIGGAEDVLEPLVSR
jgi:hypothetical protein